MISCRNILVLSSFSWANKAFLKDSGNSLSLLDTSGTDVLFRLWRSLANCGTDECVPVNIAFADQEIMPGFVAEMALPAFTVLPASKH